MTPDVARTLVSAASALMPTPPLRMDTRVCSADTLAGVLALVGHASACQGEHSSPLGFGLSCGRQSCLQAAFQAAFSVLALWVGQPILAAAGFQLASAGFSPPSWYATNFSGFVSLKCCAAKPEKFVGISRKPAKSRLHPERPPHERPKPRRRPEAHPTKTHVLPTVGRASARHLRPQKRTNSSAGFLGA